MSINIRAETAADLDAIRHVNRLAFGQDDEARLVDALRDGGYARLSLVAERAGQVVGHILFSDLPIITEAGAVPALALAPMAVLPEFQRDGVGSALVRRGLDECRRLGHRVVVVLGHPHFYSRFGFSTQLASALASPFGGGDSWMALELTPGALANVVGRADYPPPFGAVPEVRAVRNGDQAEWLRMRSLLWPDDAHAEHAREVAGFFSDKSFGWSGSLPAVAVFVAVRPSGGLCGFLEASLRPFADGCETRPVGYVEGWFVDPEMRRRGVGRSLVAVAERWATAHGCREMASDAHLENTVSVMAHRALGFEETSRAVHLRKRLTVADGGPPGQICATRPLTLIVADGTFAVCRLEPGATVPGWAAAGDFFSITRTADELSVVCPEGAVPEGVKCERGWRCLRVAGAMPFSLVGVLASLTGPVAASGLGAFAVSTFDTDYLFVKEAEFPAAIAALRAAGHSVEGVVP